MLKFRKIIKDWVRHLKLAIAFNSVKNFFEAASPPLISEAGEKELRRQALIKMMKQDQEAGLYDDFKKDDNG